jgi:hypothetical protein
VTISEEDGERNGIYARLAEESEVRYTTRRPPRGTRLVGWAICLALIGAVLAAALQVHPW